MPFCPQNGAFLVALDSGSLFHPVFRRSTIKKGGDRLALKWSFRNVSKPVQMPQRICLVRRRGTIMLRAIARIGHPLVPWKRDALHKSRSAAPGWQGATTEHIGHM
jgi:hypothetical protein